MRHVTDDERRARLATRHALAPGSRAPTAEAATRAMVVLHATEPATVYLTCRARVDGIAVADIERAIYEERSIVRQLAMRRTLFVFPRDLVPAALASASTRVAATEGARMAKEIAAAGVAADGAAWLLEARARVLALLAQEPAGLTAAEVRALAPALAGDVPVAAADPWSASRVLLHLGLTGHVTRGTNTSHWRTSRPRWTLTGHWLGESDEAWTAADGYRELVRRWLHAFGPGTEDDIVWWLGSTKAVVRAALAELAAAEVSLDGGATGWLLPDDLDEVADPGPWTALLPVLDPTTMGWKGRDFYLGPHRDALFDRNGNAGTTAWVDGRVVGAWVQDEAGVVELRMLEPVSAAERAALDEEAERLTAWLDGVRVGTVYKSPIMRS